jgi:RNA polymerase sigma factor (sigma-70 family)
MSPHDASQFGDPLVPTELDAQLLSAAQSCRRSCVNGIVPSDKQKDAQRRFYDLYKPLVRCFVAARGMRGMDAEDCRHDAWTKILERLPEFVSDGTQAGLCSWIHAIVRSIAANHRRYRTRHPTKPLGTHALLSLACPDADPATEYERHRREERVHWVIAALATRLPELSYLAFCKHWIEQKTPKEVAAELNVTEEEIYSRLWKAKEKFRILYGQMNSIGGGVELLVQS